MLRRPTTRPEAYARVRSPEAATPLVAASGGIRL